MFIGVPHGIDQVDDRRRSRFYHSMSGNMEAVAIAREK